MLPRFIYFKNCSVCFINLFTNWGLALPSLTFITCPTKKPNNCSLPFLYSATWLGKLLIICSIISCSALLSFSCTKLYSLIMKSGSAGAFQAISNTSFANLPEIVLSEILLINYANIWGVIGDFCNGKLCLFNAPIRSPVIQLHTILANLTFSSILSVKVWYAVLS